MTRRICVMRKFCSLQFRRLVAAALLLTGLLAQTQALFACDLTDSKPQAVCCCGDQVTAGCEIGGGCKTHDDALTIADCCEVSLENVFDVTLSATVLSSSQNNLNARPPPVALLTPVILIVTSANTAALIHTVPFLKTSGTNTYLITNRLRI